MVAVDAVIIEVLSCDNASMQYIFEGEKPAYLPAQARIDHLPALCDRDGSRPPVSVG
jgi:hypothetical protein